MQQYLNHLTREGERWDQLAFTYYGDAKGYEPIVCANPHVPLSCVLRSGLLLRIPILEITPRSEDLPPWFK